MDRRIAGLFESRDAAERVRQALLDEGIADRDITLHAADSLDAARSGDTDDRADSGGGVRGFFRELFGLGDDDDRAGQYAEAVRRGTCAVIVEAEGESQATRVEAVMNRFDVIDLDSAANRWRAGGWQGYDEAAPAFSDSDLQTERSHLQSESQARRIPVVEEDLRVGKREVARGGVRVYARTQDVPVEETLELREEHAVVERHPVDRPASAEDLQQLPEGGVVEVRETAEVPVVQKSARVVEEVEVGKAVERRTETVRDTVRRTDVRVEQLDEAPSAGRGKHDSPVADDRDGVRRDDDRSDGRPR